MSSNHTRKASELTRKAQRILNANKTNEQKNNKSNGGSNMMSINNGMNNVGLLNALNNKDTMRKKNNLMVSRLAGIHEDEESNKIGESYALLSNVNIHKFALIFISNVIW